MNNATPSTTSNSTPSVTTAPHWRDLSTRELFDEREHWQWLAAEVASDSTTHYPAETAAYIRCKLDGIAAELTRRERLRHHPLAPAWPGNPPDRKGELDAIRDRLSVKDLFVRYTPVELHRSGQHWRGCCPIHHGDNPEGFVVTDRWYHCYACGARGEIFTAAMQLFGLATFLEAVDRLADEAGILRQRPAARPASFHRGWVVSHELPFAQEDGTITFTASGHRYETALAGRS